MNRSNLNIEQIIRQDLVHQQQRKKRHFLPAWGLAILAIILGFVIPGGLRVDFIHQPLWQLLLQASLWMICLWLFPCIGLGLLFPKPAVRVAIVVFTLLAIPAAIFAWPLGPMSVPTNFYSVWTEHWPCLFYVFGWGLLLFGLAFLSGAWIQQRRSFTMLWIPAAITLATLNAVTWHCPSQDSLHILQSHLLPGLLLLCLGGWIAWMRRFKSLKRRDVVEFWQDA